MKRALLVGALLCCAALVAGFGGEGRDFGKLGAGWAGRKGSSGGGGVTNFLLVNTGSVLLVNTGSKMKVQ